MANNAFVVKHGLVVKGTVDVENNTITNSAANGDVSIVPNGSGRINLKGMLFPTSDGTAGHVLTTNGVGDLSWSQPSFLGLSDTPKSFGGHALKIVRVNSSESSLEYGPVLGTAATRDVGLTVGNLVEVGSDGKIDSSILPEIAITRVFVVADTTERDALDVQTGDVAKLTSTKQTYIYDGTSWVAMTVEIDTLAELGDVTIATPASGELLGYDGSKWVNVARDTASSVGLGGASVFKQKAANNFEFNSLAAKDNKVSVVLDADTNQINLGVNESNLAINNLNGTLGVTKGGTGLTTMTQNALLYGNGSNNVGLVTAPSTAETFLKWDGVSFQWSTVSAGDLTGATNVGSSGVGVFKQKTASSLEFHKLNSGSNKVSVTLNAGSDTIDLDVNEANLSLANLGGSLDASKVAGSFNLDKGGLGRTSLTTNSILVGSSSTTQVGLIAAPSSANTFLGWNGTTFAWTSMSGGDQITIGSGSTLTRVTTAEVAQTVVVTAGGKRVASFASTSGAAAGEQLKVTSQNGKMTIQAASTAGTEDISLELAGQGAGKVYFGSTESDSMMKPADQSVASNLTIEAGNPTNADSAGGNVYIRPGTPTGTGSQGVVRIEQMAMRAAVRVITASGNVTVNADDYMVILNKTANETSTVYLPPGATAGVGRVYMIKDGKGNAGSYLVTILANGSDKIDGNATTTIQYNYEAVMLVWNGNQWNIM